MSRTGLLKTTAILTDSCCAFSLAIVFRFQLERDPSDCSQVIAELIAKDITAHRHSVLVPFMYRETTGFLFRNV